MARKWAEIHALLDEKERVSVEFRTRASRKSMVTESFGGRVVAAFRNFARRRVAPAVSVGVNHFQIALS